MKKTIDQVEVKSKRVLMRVDFNVPLDTTGTITDDRRIRAALPSIKSVIERGGRLVLMSHLGRPSGSGYEASLSLKPAADRLAELLDGKNAAFPDTDCLSAASGEAIADMSDGEVVVLENLRFHAGETKNDAAFATRLASYGDIYCNDAFGTAHRDHASMVGVPGKMIGRPRVAGFLLLKEIEYFDKVLSKPEKPFVAIMGGAKVSDKLGVIEHLMGKVDTILVGGAMAYTFLRVLGQDVGKSRVELDRLDDARRAIDAAAASPTDLVLPTDHVAGKEITKHSPVKMFEGNIDAGWMGLDIGPKTVAHYCSVIQTAKTIVWNGPMGVAEISPFDVGSRQIAEAIVEATATGATSVIGGGDSAAVVESFGLADRFSHVSTGGGAGLELLEGRQFTSISMLDEA